MTIEMEKVLDCTLGQGPRCETLNLALPHTTKAERYLAMVVHSEQVLERDAPLIQAGPPSAKSSPVPPVAHKQSG